MLQQIIGFPRAVYNFIVGDPILLTGVLAIFVVIGVITHATRSLSMAANVLLGIVLIASVITSLALSLYRETRPKKG
jgi:uncharacterized membrane protein